MQAGDEAEQPMVEAPAADPIFADPRLAQLYDVFDGPRHDLASYLDIATELQARSILDVGCGTGSFAVLAASRGFAVTAVDPAAASLAIARTKPYAERVTWQHGGVESAPMTWVDLALMTGNVAQVFLTDRSWADVLQQVRARLNPGGHLVFETRRMADRAWERWARDPDKSTMQVPGVGAVKHWREILSVELPLVSFRHSYRFPDGDVLESDSTLRFRTDAENRASLADAGFAVVDVRDAADRPGAEFVYMARR
jgi:SAM-dependent methyltransferase